MPTYLIPFIHQKQSNNLLLRINLFQMNVSFLWIIWLVSVMIWIWNFPQSHALKIWFPMIAVYFVSCPFPSVTLYLFPVTTCLTLLCHVPWPFFSASLWPRNSQLKQLPNKICPLFRCFSQNFIIAMKIWLVHPL